MPDKWLFGVLLLAWCLVFYFYGNPNLGHRDIRTPSLFFWMYYAYTNPGSEDGHGLMIPFIVLGLLWWKRSTLMATDKRHWPPALAGLLLSGLLHLAGFSMQQHRLSIVGLFLGIYSLVALVWGPRFAARCFFPFVLFAYCLPVGMMVDTVTFPLRRLATDVSVWISQVILGLGVIKDGVQIVDPDGRYQYEVAAACSGLRSLIALSLLTVIYGFMTYTSTWKRLLFVFISGPIAIITNVLRLLAIIIAAEAFGEDAGHFVHEWFGFVTFIFALIVVLLLGRWIKPDGPDSGTAAVSAAPA